LNEIRKQKEREFHDKLRMVSGDVHVTDTRWSPEIEDTIKNNPMWANMKYYSIERQSRNMVVNWFKENCTGKRVLDYCCGNGADSIIIAQNGAAEVIGIDISDVSIRNCQDLAKKNHLDNIASFLVRDAENTGFEDNYFDIITEYGCLHHLDLEKAFAELSRVLKPDGKVICNESLGHNPVIHLYRKMTSHLRTEWEVDHIIRKPHFKVAEKYFDHIELRFYHLFTLLGFPLRNTTLFSGLLSGLEKIDNILLKLPLIKWQAWQVIFILSKPKQN
jgi:ubiquinone/menaquinone biosynthesis C-methylase UbiE